MKLHKTGPRQSFDKYALYLQSVQSPDTDAEFLRATYQELRKRQPKILREDFCGTFQLCIEWAKLNTRHQSFGLDLDPEPLQYGREALQKMPSGLRARVQTLEMNVLDPKGPRSDLTVAMNFSYFIFQTRSEIVNYFRRARRSLNENGLLFLDVFGGSACADANEEKTVYPNFNYYWHQHGYDPVTARAKFSIHFKPKGMRKIEDVFTYDWRMWTIPELREALHDAGFTKSHVYWEGTNRRGGGNGVFTRTEKGEECQAWIAYLVAEK